MNSIIALLLGFLIGFFTGRFSDELSKLIESIRTRGLISGTKR